MPQKTANQKDRSFATVLAWVVFGILCLLPLHALLTTWAGAAFGYIDVFRVWKEFLTIGLGVACLVLVVRNKPLRKQIINFLPALLIGLYILLAFLRTASGFNEGLIEVEAALYGTIGAFRYFVFFIVVWLIASRSNVLQKWWPFAVIAPATIVTLFGLLQQFVLDKNFLTHFGYGKETIPAFQSVDQKTDYIRAQSTLRGPNPLGAYLSLVIVILIGLFYRLRKYRFVLGFLITASAVLLFFTYSRSAWIGLIVSTAVWIFLTVKNQRLLRFMTYGAVAGFIVVLVGIFMFRNNDYVQNTIFHTDETSQASASTNEVRNQAIRQGLKDVVRHPLGQGLGSAGPASARGNNPKIAENYYIQVAQEVGVIGLLIYVAITVLVGVELYRKRQQLLAQVLLASLIGISVINLFSHAWMDDTLSMLWWGLAGIALAPSVILKEYAHEKNGKNKKITKTS